MKYCWTLGGCRVCFCNIISYISYIRPNTEFLPLLWLNFVYDGKLISFANVLRVVAEDRKGKCDRYRTYSYSLWKMSIA